MGDMYTPSPGHWAICYHTNSTSPRARKWYYLARVVQDQDKWFELYRVNSSFEDASNERETREAVLSTGLYTLLHGLFTAAPSPRTGSEIVRVK